MIYKLILRPLIRAKKTNSVGVYNILIQDFGKLITEVIGKVLSSNVGLKRYNSLSNVVSYTVYNSSFIEQERMSGYDYKIILSLLLKITTLENRVCYLNYVMGEIPGLYLNNAFLINGIEKIFINKITINKRGIYFNKYLKGEDVCTVCRYILDESIILYMCLEKGKLYITVNNRKFDFLSFLTLLGISYSQLSKYGKCSTLNYREELYEISTYKQSKESERVALSIVKIIYLRRFEKGKIAKSLEEQLNLFFLELISIREILYSVNNNRINLSETDALANKYIIGAKDCFLYYFKLYLSRNFDSIRKDIEDLLPSLSHENNHIYLKAKSTNYFSLKSYISIVPHIQCLDKTNSLAEVTHGNKINNYNLSSQAGVHIRNVRLNNLGYICPIDTTEGINCGITLGIAKNTRFIEDNNLEVPLLPYNLEKSSLNYLFINHPLIEQSAVIFNKDTTRRSKYFSTEHPTVIKNSLKLRQHNKHSSLFLINYGSILSYPENLIPFLFYNDPSRVLMGARMQTQSLPLLKKTRYFLSTGEEKDLTISSGYSLYSKQEGVVVYVSNNKIILRDVYNRKHIYYLRKFRVNNYSVVNQTPIVWVGERIYLGQVLTSAQDLIGSEFNVGTTVTAAYGNFFGYNFEDAIVINKRAVYTNLFTSVKTSVFETTLTNLSGGDIEFSVNVPFLSKGLYQRNLDKYGIIKEGVKVEEGDTLISKFVVSDSLLDDLKSFFILMLFGKYIRLIKDKSLLVSKGNDGRVIKVEILSSADSNIYLRVRIFVMKQRLLRVGDKLCGYYGNKGVISYVVPNKDMIYTTDGISPDLITDAIGIPSRMNLGQLFEGLCGLSYIYNNIRTSIANSRLVSKGYLKHIIYNYMRGIPYLTGKKELYKVYSPGNLCIRSGFTGFTLKEPSFLGVVRYFKLMHMVSDKIHYRTVGPYTEVIQQPMKGRDNIGGQRFGEMEIWALQAYGNSYTLRELLEYRSDDLRARDSLLSYYNNDGHLGELTVSEAFNIFMNEVNSISLTLDTFAFSKTIPNVKINVNKFSFC